MKLFSYLKAIASGLIWGLGQLLNGQFLKALFFFVFFVTLLGIEFGTSHYFEDTDAYDKLIGNDFGDEWYKEGFVPEYLYNGVPYQPFEDYLVEIGGVEFITEDSFIQFLAKDLKDNNPNTYTNLTTREQFLADDFDATDKVLLRVKQTLYQDENGIFYAERTIKQLDGSSTKEYVETTMLTGELNESNILYDVTDLTLFVKTGEIFRAADVYYAKVIDDGTTDYINLLTFELFNPGNLSEVVVNGPLYNVDGTIYEYFEPGLIYNSVRLQYVETPIFETFRQAMLYTYSYDWNQYTGNDYTRLMIKLYLELNPEIRDQFKSDYNNFFYDKAGLFVRGYWAVGTLGIAKKVSFTGHMALMDTMVGNSSTTYDLGVSVNILDPVPIQGHVSLLLLLEGLIGVIGSMILFVFMFWSIRDAYKISELKRKKEKVVNDVQYFKNVYESSFEYIILSPAMIVLAFISIMPIAFGFIIAFTNIAGNESQLDTFDWVGLQNFFSLFNFTSGLGSSFGEAFWRVLGWTIIWAIFSTFTVFFGGFFQALILNSERVVFRKLWRTILILPWAIPALLSQMVFSVMFNEIGFINTFLQDIGIYNILHNLGLLGVNFDTLTGFSKLLYLGQDNIQWFTNPFNPTFVRTTLIVVNIWLGFPYFMALMTGVMTAIDATLYEAADIDGANRFQKISLITMPLVLYSTAPILIMTFSGNFNNFGVIYFITGGGPNANHASRGFAGDTDILISWMYKLTVDYQTYNMASVFSVLIFLFVGSLTAWNLSRTRAFTED
ncbi:MAG: sugar ABC transporter permease [Acholeplasmataceae bacterium]|nr:sugar ABC transporter permease [Acholeplasmataceae bacterium]